MGLHYWIRLVGDGELAVRFPSIAAGVLLVPLTYRLARRVAGPGPSLLAALLVALNPFLIWHSQDARMYALAALFGAASLHFAARGTGGEVYPAGLVASGALLLATHYAGAYLLLAENLAAGWLAARTLARPDADRRRLVRWLARWLSGQAAIVALSLPWWLYACEVLLHRTIAWLEPLSLPSLLLEAGLRYSLGPAGGPEPSPLALLPFLPPLALGLAVWARRPPGQLFAIWLAGPLLAAYATSLGRAVFVDRYFIYLVPLYALALAVGLAAAARRSRPLAVLGLAALLAATGSALAGYYLDPRAAKAPDWRAVGQAIADRRQPGDLLVVNSPDPALAFYVRRLAGPDLPSRTLPASSPPDVPATESALATLLAERPRLWTVPVRDPGWDAAGLVEGWLDAFAQPAAEERFGGLRLRLYLSPRALLAARPRPAPLRFGEELELLGHDFSADGSPGQPGTVAVRPGGELWLTLYFRAVRPVAADYRVFNHLLDEMGERRGQHDGPPVFGRLPTPAWRPGELVMDRHRLAVAPASPPGRYRVLTGLYEPASGRRLPLTDAGGRVLGDAVALEGVVVVR